MIKSFLVTLIILWLSACVFQPNEKFVPALTEGNGAMVPTPPPSPPFVSTPYKDNQLCFTVDVPTGWVADGVPGGFASFKRAGTDLPAFNFNITNVALGTETPTLEQALEELRRGPFGTSIQEVKDFVVDGRPALWATLPSGAEFPFVVMVIAPDCGAGPHALFIAATEADREAFEAFLGRIRFFQQER